MLLKKINVPCFFINIILALFMNVRANPVLNTKHKIFIHMKNGLKQGCPLSCLLYVLALDPLLTNLDCLPGDSKAYFDDIALGLPCLAAGAPYATCFHAYHAATNSDTNLKKLQYISADDTVAPTTAQLGGLWSCGRLVPSATHLGVRMGRDLTVSDVFFTALCKFKTRINSFIPHKAQVGTQARVAICNSFLFPIFSYLCHFFKKYIYSNEHVQPDHITASNHPGRPGPHTGHLDHQVRHRVCPCDRQSTIQVAQHQAAQAQGEPALNGTPADGDRGPTQHSPAKSAPHSPPSHSDRVN